MGLFRAEPGSRFERTPASILFALRLLWEKGLPELIEATRILAERKVRTILRCRSAISRQPERGACGAGRLCAPMIMAY
jgi:hypothetical protein